jgi:hypothetical protein
MKFKGHNWRISHTVIVLDSGEQYLRFGRICAAHGHKDAVKTTFKLSDAWKDYKKGDYLFARPLPLTGHSLTNMAYGMPTRRKTAGGWYIYRMPMYLCLGGACYSSSYECSKDVYDRHHPEPDVTTKKGFWIEELSSGFHFTHRITNGTHEEKATSITEAFRLCKSLNQSIQ